MAVIIQHPMCRGYGHAWSPPTWTVVLDGEDRVIAGLTANVIQCERCTTTRVFYYLVNKDSTLGPRANGGGYRYVANYLSKSGERITRHDAVSATFRFPKRTTPGAPHRKDLIA